MLKVTSLHGLRSGNAYDYSHNIAETTHQEIRFTRYNNEQPKESWEAIIATDELFKLLKPVLKKERK